MLGFFGSLKEFLKFDHVWIDNNVFRLHYKATVIIFITSSLFVTSRQYIGDPIDCMVDGIPGGIMDTYCWIHSTYSIPTRWVGTQGQDIPHPGVAPLADLALPIFNDAAATGIQTQQIPQSEKKYHKYYQWVAFMLFLHAVFFYLPRYLWKSSEGGKIKMLVGSLHADPMLNADAKADQIAVIVKYFRLHRGTHGMYAMRFFGCEVLNFVNVIGQIFFIDTFLNGEFSTYGLRVFQYSGLEAEDRPDPMAVVFPKVTKCTFHKYGPSGTVQLHDGLCVLPSNIINEKIYIFLWLWLISLAVVTGVFLVYRVAVILGSQIRVALITIKGGKSTKRQDVEAILEPQSLNFFERLGDWLVLHLVCKNLNALLVNDLIKQLHKDTALQDFGDNSNTLPLKPDSKKESSAV